MNLDVKQITFKISLANWKQWWIDMLAGRCMRDNLAYLYHNSLIIVCKIFVRGVDLDELDGFKPSTFPFTSFIPFYKQKSQLELEGI